MINLPSKITGYRSKIINEIIDCLQALVPVETPTIRHEFRANGIASVVKAMPWLPTPSKHFTHQMVDKDHVAISAGVVRIHARGNVAVAKNDSIALSGSPAWVYVEVDRLGLTGSFRVSNTEPVSEGGYLRVPLLKFTPVGSGFGEPEICHDGDINVDTAA